MILTRALVAATCVVVVAAAGTTAIAQPGDPLARIAGEAARIKKSSGALGDQAENIVTILDRVKASVAAGRVYFALDELQEPWTIEAATRWAGAHAAVKTGEQFSAEWKRVGEPRWAPAGPALPAAIEAIAAANASRAPATWHASLPYSEDAGIAAGLYYLGEAQAYVAFAAFTRALPLARHGTPVAFKPMGSEIGALELEVAALYDKAPASLKTRFIRPSVALKVARTLDEHGDYGAALYQYLTAKYRATVAAAPDAPAGDVKGRLASARARLDAGQDHSIAEIFLERAAYLLEQADPSAAKSAAVIADAVLPAYVRLVQR